MSYIALYRKWRPITFDEVIEQEHVTRTLKNAVKTGRIAHAYLFSGTRGTGKTSMAYIMSRAVNCLDPQDGNPCNKCEICKGILNNTMLDVIEMDAASNNGVENIRAIRDEVAYAPAMAKFKVYIIDEVHMLSTGAFNALLKTLEEPPSHVIFILATTEPHRLPATVLSRCQRYDFHRISAEGITKRLNQIIEEKEVTITDRAMRIIARVANGALRDAISLLDQCLSSGSTEINVDIVLESAGILHDEAAADIAQALFDKNIPQVLEIADAVLMQGKSPAQFLSSLIYYYRNLLICTGVENPEMFIESSDDMIAVMKDQATLMGSEFVTYVIRELSAAEATIKKSLQPRTYLEVVLINISSMNISFPEQASLRERISALENKINRLKNAPPANSPAIDNSRPVANTRKPVVADIKKKQSKVALPKKKADMNPDFKWNDVINQLNNQNAMEVAPYLPGSSATLAGNELSITFIKDFNKNMIGGSRGNIAIIKEAVDKMFRTDCEVNIYSGGTTVSGGDFFEEKAKQAEALGVKLEIE
ncbi:MAG: DNA polymerase III subunit gamma/tau [Clostridiales bacterium]|nr:DNA polymerase III subunit gamma/tau [Clostridiales bacterium]